MLIKQICDRLKGSDSRINKPHESRLGYKSFSWVQGILYWWSNIDLLGLSIRKKGFCLIMATFFFSFLECIEEVTLQDSKLWINLSIFYIQGVLSGLLRKSSDSTWTWREPKVLYVCFWHRSLHFPVTEQIFSRQAVWGNWIKRACDQLCFCF